VATKDWTVIYIDLAKENNSGKSEPSRFEFQTSSQKKHEEPSETVIEANPLKGTKHLRVSIHQKEPLLLTIGKAPVG
jgi:hypothetical protein